MKKTISILIAAFLAAVPAFSQTVFICGDSTAADKNTLDNGPERGWGMLFREYVGSQVSLVNCARNGESTKRFIDNGLWARMIADVRKGDYVIIGFGHNDEKVEDPKRFTDPNGLFKDNLRWMISEVRAKEANPVLYTPICRRNFDNGVLIETHYRTDMADSTTYHQSIRELAAETGTPLVDLQKETEKWLNELGDEASKEYFKWVPEDRYTFCKRAAGMRDNTHPGLKGAAKICEMVASGLKDVCPELKLNTDPIPERVDSILYFDARDFGTFGKISKNTCTAYERLPKSSRDLARDKVWRLAHCSTGLYVKFKTDSPTVRARWTAWNGASGSTQALTGVRGVDLYVYEDGCWNFVQVGAPSGKVSDKALTDKMRPAIMREYMMYLPLYDGIDYLEIGIANGYVIAPSEIDSPKAGKAVVVYGTSITQGGNASRPGMNFTSILSRYLDREFVNLGFSGSGRLDYDVADVIAASDNVGCVVFDYIGNATKTDIEEKGETFYRIIRDAHPDIPIVFQGGRMRAKAKYNILEEPDACIAQKKLFDKLKAQGEKNIYYIPDYDMTQGRLRDQTIDGDHLLDLGFQSQADYLYPYYKKILKKH